MLQIQSLNVLLDPGTITTEGLHKVIENIGASNLVSELDIETIMDELGGNDSMSSSNNKDTIQVATMLQIDSLTVTKVASRKMPKYSD